MFATYADPIVHLGPLGSGQVTKILNNLLFTANLGSRDEHPRTRRIPWHRPQYGSCEVLTSGSATSKALGSIAGFGGTLDSSRRSRARCCRRTSGTPRASPTAASAPQGAVFDAADAALSSMDHPR